MSEREQYARQAEAWTERAYADAAAYLRHRAELVVSLGPPLAVGLAALALTLAVLGYCAVQLGWRAYVVLAWRRRQKSRRARAK